ncbi:acyl-CoA synthetase short-chain family member 3, mitochondrial isoform X2 [Zootoca vivipara]|uniref:acyl-CoA synthetase short-chain family member 3, mitochondrial isoform X2 n=1 Tax=Zootoca vivipara TaxID=8524 RepID=UPI00293BC7A2|nr:acyl-CoA synthetase short-chain family member 3, mitochondrial isoform X2 [Zootoca vivipara]
MSAQQCRRAWLHQVARSARGLLWAPQVGLRRVPPLGFPSCWTRRPPAARLLLPLSRSLSSRAAAPGGDYEAVFRASVEEPEKHWAEAAQGIEWHKPWAQTMQRRDPYSTSWFVGGELNICYNAIDRHVKNGQGDQIAIIHDSPVTNAKEFITYKELLEQVSKLSGVMRSHGVKKGDRVVIYMPMIPQTMYTMLACARIGAIHSLIFGGFASKELSSRIDHAKPKLVVTANFGIEPGRKVEYIPLLEKALEMIEHQPDKVLVYSRPNMGDVALKPGRDLDWHEEMAKAKPCDCVPVLSDHPLYILYTSGTTGTPKGVVRPTGGYAVMLNWTMSAVYGLKSKEVWWAASDLGWVVGHSYICYGPLLHGNTTVLYEGKPVGTPDAGAFFRVLAEHGVVALFTAPTAIRAIRQQDPEANLGKQHSLTRFRTLFVAGERCDVDTLEWCKKIFKVPVLDHWWQTESWLCSCCSDFLGLLQCVGLPLKVTRKLQLIQNAAARLVTGGSRRDHITPVLKDLHWFSVCFRAQFKVLVLTFKALNGLDPVYLKERLHPHRSAWTLRSSTEGLLAVPSLREAKLHGTRQRAFSVMAPALWNFLPSDVKEINNYLIFRRQPCLGKFLMYF